MRYRLPENEDTLSTRKGYRNFVSFVSIEYYGSKKSLKECGKIIGITPKRMHEEMKKRGFEIRNPGPLPGRSVKRKKRINIDDIVKAKTEFPSPEEAFKTLYGEYFLTQKEIGRVLGISTTSVRAFFKEYGIETRNQGVRKMGGSECQKTY